MSHEALTATEVAEIIEAELASMPADLAVRARQCLVAPYVSIRSWAYGPETFRCWIVLKDGEGGSGTGIAFSSQGVSKPRLKWILLRIGDNSADVGQDSGWFASLEDAFSGSFMAGEHD